jgi:hypothetical protein
MALLSMKLNGMARQGSSMEPMILDNVLIQHPYIHFSTKKVSDNVAIFEEVSEIGYLALSRRD